MTTQYKEIIINVLTGQTTERPYTADEIAEVEAQLASNEIESQALAAKEAARQAVYTKLGLTPDEVAALLG
jgi:phosphopantetheinyl transferase (holo-ACP synthase)